MAVRSSHSPTAPKGDRQALLRAASMLVGLLLIGLVLRLSPMLSPKAVALWLGHGPRAVAGFVLGGALACAAGLPRQAVAFAGGYVFGLWDGLAAAMLAQALGCAGGFLWARHVGRDWARKFMQRGRLARADRFLSAQPFAATLMLRLLPVGNNMALNMLAGVSGIDAWAFLVASLIGFVPQTLIFALLGSGVEVAQGWRIGMAVALFALSGGLGLWLLRRYRARQALGQSAQDEISGQAA